MKRLLFLFFVLFSVNAWAQPGTLILSAEGKYLFYQVIEAPGLSADSLASHAKQFFRQQKKELELSKTEADTAFHGKGKLVLSKIASFVTHPSAEVTYTITLEIKNGKYRYWLTDFVISPYMRDRYGNFVPAGNSYPLEKTPTKLDAAEWKGYISSTEIQCNKVAARLKEVMLVAKKALPVDSEKKAIPEKW